MAGRLRVWAWWLVLGLPGRSVSLWVADWLFGSVSIASPGAAVRAALILSVVPIVFIELVLDLFERRSGLAVLLTFVALFSVFPALWLTEAFVPGITLDGVRAYLGAGFLYLGIDVAFDPLTSRMSRRWGIRHPRQVEVTR